MPIKKTGAPLWFGTKEEEDAYDDRMVSNIELKSLDFDDENFSPVFDRAKQEYFLQPGQKVKADLYKIQRSSKKFSPEELIDKYFSVSTNHTYWRSFTLEKFLSGFAFGYIILRELPLRNFYARSLIMCIFAAKLFDHYGAPFPSLYPKGSLAIMKDKWLYDDIKTYDVVMTALKYTDVPTANNDVRESRKWNARQPAHMRRADVYSLRHWVGAPFKKAQQAYWDGTMNMPILRLADPKHRDCYETRFV